MITYADEPCTCDNPAIKLVLDARSHVIRGACAQHLRNIERVQQRRHS